MGIAHTTQSILQEKIWMLPIIFTCTHCTHYPQNLARKNMDATYYFHLHTLHTPHTLPTSVQTTHYDTMTGIYVSIIFTCTHRTHRTLYPQLLERKNMDALYFGLHTSHTLPTASCKKKYGCYLLFSPAHTAHPTHISPNQPL